MDCYVVFAGFLFALVIASSVCPGSDCLKLDADKATDGKCIHYTVNEDWIYCLDTRFYCKMCMKNTRYTGPCKENEGPANCVQCERETWNPSDFHMNKTCLPIPSNSTNNPDDEGVIRLPKYIPDRQTETKKYKASDNNQGIHPSLNSPLYFILLLFCLLTMN